MAAGAWDRTAAIIAGIRSGLGDTEASQDAYNPYRARQYNQRQLKRFIQQQKKEQK